MPATFNQQLRYLRKNEPSLYESISKAYRKYLMESNLGPQVAMTNEEAAETPVEKTEISQTQTKGVNDLMDKVHAMVGVNENKKEGDEIFDNTDDNIETVKPDPQQQADLFGQPPPPAENVGMPAPDMPQPIEQPAEQPMAQPIEQPVESNGDFDLGNMFGDDTQSGTTTEPAPAAPVDENAAAPVETSSEQPAAGNDSDIDLGNMFGDEI